MEHTSTQIIERKTPQTKEEAIRWSRNLLARIDWVILDTETTGRNMRLDRIVEITIMDGKGTILFQSLINPERPIPPDTQAYNGITNEDVQRAPKLPEVWSTVSGLLRGRWVICYNAEFDATILKESAGAYHLGLGRLHTYCAMKVYLAYAEGVGPYGRAPYYKLADACARHGISIGQSHRSSNDCLATLRLIEHMAGTQDEPVPALSSVVTPAS